MLTGGKLIITGAAGGLGLEIAKQALSANAQVAVFEKNADRLAQALSNWDGNPQISGWVADLRDPEACEQAVGNAREAMGGITGLVNNAAILSPDDSDPIQTPLESWQETLAVNVSGAFLMCKYALPALIENGGAIVTLSSVVAHAASAIPQIAYTTSKGALEAMTREIAITYARQNVRANCVAPGPVLTERTAHYFDTPEKWEKRRKHIPMGRLGRAEEIAALVIFLLSSQAGFITGSTYLADGGISSAYIVDDAQNASDKP